MSEVRRYRFAHDEPLDLAEKSFFGHDRASEKPRFLVARNKKAAARCGFQPVSALPLCADGVSCRARTRKCPMAFRQFAPEAPYASVVPPRSTCCVELKQ